jgi:hypothetical protein
MEKVQRSVGTGRRDTTDAGNLSGSAMAADHLQPRAQLVRMDLRKRLSEVGSSRACTSCGLVIARPCTWSGEAGQA